MVTQKPGFPSLKNYNSIDAVAAPLKLSVPAGYAGMRLDRVLATLLPAYSRNRLAQWVRDGRVTLDGRATSPRQKVSAGSDILVVPSADRSEVSHRPEPIMLDVLFEDDTLLVVNKPAGLVVHPGSGNWSGTLLNALLARLPALAAIPRAGIVHRLDKDTSGLLVVAKTLPAQTQLVRQLQARTVGREYLAVVHGDVARNGMLDAPIGRHPVKRTRMAVSARGRPAITHYQVLERFGPATLLRCRLETGRTHQIRVHLSSLRHPLVGDPVYGQRRAAIAFARQALHAERLRLLHPATRKTVEWQADPPADLQELISSLRTSSQMKERSSITGHRSRRS